MIDAVVMAIIMITMTAVKDTVVITELLEEFSTATGRQSLTSFLPTLSRC